MSVINLLDLMDEDDWRDLQDSVSRLLGIAPITIQKDGSQLFPQTYISEACRLIRNSDKGLALCRFSNKEIVMETMQLRRPVVTTCHAGFLKLALPIIEKRQFLGIIGGCMVLQNAAIDAPTYRRLATEIGIDDSKLLRGIQEMKTLDGIVVDRAIKQLERVVKLKIAGSMKRTSTPIKSIK